MSARCRPHARAPQIRSAQARIPFRAFKTERGEEHAISQPHARRLSLTDEEDGTTVIRGPVVDQAALHGLLHKLRDVGIPLVSLTQVSPDAPTEPHALRPYEGN